MQTEYKGEYWVKQGGGESSKTGAQIQAGDKVTVVELPQKPTRYSLTVTRGGVTKLELGPLTWDSETYRLEGEGKIEGTIVLASIWSQEGPYALKVLYGTIIETDPDSVGAWSATDQPPTF